MRTVREQLTELFAELNARIEEINGERRKEGGFPVPKARVRLLGQISLLVHAKASILSLAQTGDMDALLNMDDLVKIELKKLLKREGFVYDEDSDLIWVPERSRFETLLGPESCHRGIH